MKLLTVMEASYYSRLPHLNLLSFSEQPIFSQMFVNADCMARCLVLYCGNGSN